MAVNCIGGGEGRIKWEGPHASLQHNLVLNVLTCSTFSVLGRGETSPLWTEMNESWIPVLWEKGEKLQLFLSLHSCLAAPNSVPSISSSSLEWHGKPQPSNVKGEKLANHITVSAIPPADFLQALGDLLLLEENKIPGYVQLITYQELSSSLRHWTVNRNSSTYKSSTKVIWPANYWILKENKRELY